MSARTLCVIGAALLLGMTAGAKAAVSADVPYVPTPWNVVETMFDMAQVTAADHLIDLGSGDGRIVIEAVKKRGARGFGIELDPHLVKIAKEEAQKQGVAGRAAFAEGNLFTFNLHEASVLTMYLYPQVLMHLRPKLFEQLKPGTRVVSYVFAMEDWEPDEWVFFDNVQGMLWVVPARFDGNWRIQTGGPDPATYEVNLTQRFQKINGQFMFGSAKLPLFDANVLADRLRFTLVVGQRRFDFVGNHKGAELEGTLFAVDVEQAVPRAGQSTIL